MRIKNILISLIIISVLLTGCGVYDYSKGKEIPISVAEGEEDVDDFKSEFEKLQDLIDEGDKVEEESDEVEGDLEEVVEEESEEVVVEEEEKETAEEEEVVEEETVEETEEIVEEVEETEEVVEEEELTIPEGVATIKISEGELVNLAIESEDDDEDTITYTFTEPLDNDGKWQTDFGDEGSYKITITASDGDLSTSQDVYIIVDKVNRAPVISDFDDMTVDEGDTIELNPTVTDPEDGSVSLEYSGWMTTGTKEVGYDDAGEYEVTLTATGSTGEEATETITITVNNKNRAPKILSITNK